MTGDKTPGKPVNWPKNWPELPEGWPTRVEDLTDEQFRYLYPPPEYLALHQEDLRGVLQDQSGQWWAFIDMVCVSSGYSGESYARLRIHDDIIELGIPGRFADDDPRADVPEGCAPVLLGPKRDAITVSFPADWVGHQGRRAVPLPFKPRELRIIDNFDD